ncbi:hypothetical protein RPYSC3_23110 [Rhodopseudomonas palustris]|nr:hypothetical protein RPYSC3_23110 [Rhodopseudomonas palustris]
MITPDRPRSAAKLFSLVARRSNRHKYRAVLSDRMPAARHARSLNFERFQDAPRRSGRAWLLGTDQGTITQRRMERIKNQIAARSGPVGQLQPRPAHPVFGGLVRKRAARRCPLLGWPSLSAQPEIALRRSLLTSISSRTRAYRTGGRLRRTFASLTRRILRFALKVDSRGRRASCGRARKDLPRQPDETIKILPSRPSLYNSISLLLAPFDDTLRASRAGGLRYLYCRSPAIS